MDSCTIYLNIKNLKYEVSRAPKSIITIGSNSRKEHGDQNKLDNRDEIDDNKVNGNKIENNDIAEEKNYQKMSKSKKLSKSKKMEGFLGFFTFRARLPFTKLRQTFIKALIFYHFDLEYHN